MTWHKRARIGVAAFGIAVAIVVFVAIGERRAPVAAPPLDRFDPAAVLESSGSVLKRITGATQDFTVTSERQLTYENGATRLINVRIAVNGREGRDFVITGREAEAGEKQQELQLTGDVTLSSSDGFELNADRATFSEQDGLVRAPGPITFRRGAMRGSGVGMTYDRNTDVLTIADECEVRILDTGANTTMQFTAGRAVLARQDDYLQLEGLVHVLRGEQMLDAERAKAMLTPNEDLVTYIELRGKAQVAGGSTAFESMHADAIDLDYADDGETLERVILNGDGTIALAAAHGASGRQLHGESLTVVVAPDGAVTSATGRRQVELHLPAANDAPARQIQANELDAQGEAGKGLTSARFADTVEYRETRDDGTRTAVSQRLDVRLDGDTVTSAAFSGRVRFGEQGLTASAAEARYEPAAGTLRLTERDAGGGPRVADERIAIEADAIDVTLEGRKMRANGAVKTILQGSATTPGLLAKEQPANVSADVLDYDGASGRALYRGAAQLWQGETAIRADALTIDSRAGELLARGSARSTLQMDGALSVGRADTIEYADASREVSFRAKARPLATVSPTPPKPATTPATGAAAPAFEQAQLSGPQGDLQSDRIVVTLAKDENRMERLEAFDHVTLRLDTRVATGARLTYHAEDERYVMSGVSGAPVKVIEQCRETTGNTLTFFKSADRIIVDGNEERRTHTRPGGPCTDSQPR